MALLAIFLGAVAAGAYFRGRQDPLFTCWFER
jgi:hypothetical protein